MNLAIQGLFIHEILRKFLFKSYNNLFQTRKSKKSGAKVMVLVKRCLKQDSVVFLYILANIWVHESPKQRALFLRFGKFDPLDGNR